MIYFKLPVKKLENVLNYLKDKPWVEVAQIMIELTSLEKTNEEEPKKEEPKKDTPDNNS